MQAKCGVCNKEGDCRPYGERGSMICYPYMKSSPKREAEATRQFDTLLQAAAAASPFVLIDGVGGTGPQPMGGRRQ